MGFPLLHYISKNEKKGNECCQKKHNKLPIERKYKDFKNMHVTKIKNTRNPKGSNCIKGCYIKISL